MRVGCAAIAVRARREDRTALLARDIVNGGEHAKDAIGIAVNVLMR